VCVSLNPRGGWERKRSQGKKKGASFTSGFVLPLDHGAGCTLWFLNGTRAVPRLLVIALQAAGGEGAPREGGHLHASPVLSRRGEKKLSVQLNRLQKGEGVASWGDTLNCLVPLEEVTAVEA